MTGSGELDVIDLARALLHAPSPNPPGDERAAAGVVIDAARAFGLPAPRILATDDTRPNVLITLDFGPGGQHLALSGHLDTKPVGDARWETDPLAASIDGDRLYGLGAADMKAAVAAMLVAAADIARDAPTTGRLSLLFTADEEDGARFGAHYLVGSGALATTTPDAIVIGEPGGIDDDYDRLHLVSRGIARLRLVAEGRQGHSSLSGADGSDPAAGNAGVAAARAVAAVADGVPLAVPGNAYDLLGWRATVNTGLAFHGGVGYGVLPGRIAVDTEVRLLPGMDRDALRSAMQRAVDPVTVEFDAPPNDWLPATAVDPDSSLAGAARSACAEVFGASPPDAVFPGTTDAAWFGGLAGIPTLPALGPGLLRRAHGADEWVSITAVRQAVGLYAALVNRFCSVEPDGISRAPRPTTPGADAPARVEVRP